MFFSDTEKSPTSPLKVKMCVREWPGKSTASENGGEGPPRQVLVHLWLRFLMYGSLEDIFIKIS